MDVMVCTSEWQEGCLSCSSSSGYWHLSPSLFLLPHCPLLPLPASLTHTYMHLHTYTHCSASVESPLPKHLCHLSLSSLKLFRSSTPPSSVAQGDEKNEMGEKGKGRGRFIHSGGLICSERCCFGSKNFPLTRVQLILWNGCPFSRSDGTIPLVCRLGDESVWY